MFKYRLTAPCDGSKLFSSTYSFFERVGCALAVRLSPRGQCMKFEVEPLFEIPDSAASLLPYHSALRSTLARCSGPYATKKKEFLLDMTSD